MGCRIAKLSGEPEVEGSAIFYDSVTMTAFGPIFECEEEANDFANFLVSDPRSYGPKALDAQWKNFCKAFPNTYENRRKKSAPASAS